MTEAQQRKFLLDLIRHDIEKIQDVNILHLIRRIVEEFREEDEKVS